MKVLVAEPIADSGIERMRAEGLEVDVRTDLTRDQILEIIGDYDALIVRSQTKADAELIDLAGNLKVVGRAGIGIDNVDVEAATRHGIVVVNAPQSNIISAAEHTIALLMSLARDIPRADESVRAGLWERERFQGVELHGKTLAILGLGRIGTLVAQRALAFGMRVIAYDPYVSRQRASQMGVELAPSLESAMREGDFVTVHLPKTGETKALIGAEELAMLKPTARLINASRGGIVSEDALAAALLRGDLAGAALDVFEAEPPSDASILKAPNTVLTPHLGASTREAQDKAGASIAEQVMLALRGDLAPYAVNVDAGRELVDAVRPFLALAEMLGKIFTKVAGERTQHVTISYSGQIAQHDLRVLTLSALKGMLAQIVHEPVTFVNAPLLAAERGLQYAESKQTQSRDYTNMVEISGDGRAGVAGTLVGVRNEPRLVRLWDFQLEMPPGERMVFLRYDDRPGVIGAIGSILGEAGVNIADMRVGRQEKGGEALMVLSVDSPITPEQLTALTEGSGAKDAVFLSLGE